MVNEKIINAGIYIRVSTDKQVQVGYSIAAQKENLIKFTKEQNWNIFDIYADEGISGKNITDRPEVKRLINDIKNKQVDVVVLYKFDRLTRDMADTEDIIKLVQEFGIEVYTLSGGIIDVKTATGRFMTRVNGAVAQLEREQTIERVKVAFVQKVKEGKALCSGITSYGYDRPKHQVIQTINEVEAIIVKRIFKMYLDGKTFTEIANLLNAEGVPTKKKGKMQKRKFKEETYIINSMWQAKTIKLILSNITYIGGVRYGIGKSNGFEVENGLHEPIISKKEWNRVQEKIKKINPTTRENQTKDNVYYSGTLICGMCGQVLTTQRSKRTKKDGTVKIYYGYRCVNREKGLCVALGMSHKKVENSFINYIDNIEAFTELKDFELPEQENSDVVDINNMKKRLLEIVSKKKEVMNLFMNNSIDHIQLTYMTEELTKSYSIIEEELNVIQKSCQLTKEIDKNIISNAIKEHWYYLNNRERLEFLNQFLEKIVIVNRSSGIADELPEIVEVKFYE